MKICIASGTPGRFVAPNLKGLGVKSQHDFLVSKGSATSNDVSQSNSDTRTTKNRCPTFFERFLFPFLSLAFSFSSEFCFLEKL
jgi:hypothetical protein